MLKRRITLRICFCRQKFIHFSSLRKNRNCFGLYSFFV